MGYAVTEFLALIRITTEMGYAVTEFSSSSNFLFGVCPTAWDLCKSAASILLSVLWTDTAVSWRHVVVA